MIVLVTGQPGSGKSYYAVRKLAEALNSGKPVATNVQLVDGWERKLARTALLRRFIPGAVDRTAKRFHARTFISADLDELFRVRLEGKGEGRGVMVLDEAHNWLNARTWDQDETGTGLTKAEAVQRRLRIIRFFSQHRKLGWTIYLITQDAQNVDRQVRGLMEYHCFLRNLKNLKVMGLPLIPMHFFTAIWCWNDVSKAVVKRDFYRLDRKVAGLYDTLALSHGLEDAEMEPIWLPRKPEDPSPGATPAAGGETAGGRPPAAPDALPAEAPPADGGTPDGTDPPPASPRREFWAAHGGEAGR
jgi:hypothetical protein